LQGAFPEKWRRYAGPCLNRRGTFVAICLRNDTAEEHGMATVIEQIPVRSKYLTATFRAATRHCAPFNVSTREPAAVDYWCRHFDTTPERLFEAVRRVGSNPDIVRLELRAF
jgi:hypothetical protein